jgi:nicotinate (nicotinamide) nucleotide adenylyltransferase
MGDSGPEIRLIGGTLPAAGRLGLFSSSFNPVTRAHVALVELASATFELDQVIVVTGDSNADKEKYEASLEDRLAMMRLGFADRQGVSVGVTSHAFFVDMVDAVSRVQVAGAELHFILGFDTFERVLDPDGRYLGRYHRAFSSTDDAVRHLLTHSRLIVADRAAAGLGDFERLIERVPSSLRVQVVHLDFPADLAEMSATSVRALVAAGKDVSTAVPPVVGEYIRSNGLYLK